MKERPALETERLILRPHNLDDAPELQRLIGDRDIAFTTINIPHPYEDSMAEEFIQARQEKFEEGKSVDFAVVHRADKVFVGGISLALDRQNEKAEIGYWIGKPYWGQGYCTEAARAILEYGFEVIIVGDATAARNPGTHTSTLAALAKQGATIISVDDLLTQIST